MQNLGVQRLAGKLLISKS